MVKKDNCIKYLIVTISNYFHFKVLVFTNQNKRIMISKKNIWLILFCIDAVLNLYAEAIQNIPLIYITKPLLMIFLGFHFYFNKATDSSYGKLILVGLFFSFLGDTFLMFRETGARSQQLFLLGLGSFLVTQGLYFLAFWKYANGKGYIKKRPWIALIFLAFLISNSLFLLPDLPSTFKIPVLVYSTVITLMVLSCTNLYNEIPNAIFAYLIIGVLLFMCSDTLIGLNQFKKEEIQIPFPRIAIMSTYIMAQFLIVKGSIRLVATKN